MGSKIIGGSSAILAAMAVLGAGEGPVIREREDVPFQPFSGRLKKQQSARRGTQVVIDRHAAKQIEQTNAGYVLTKTSDGTVYKYGSDGALRHTVPQMRKKDRVKARRAHRAFLARQQDNADFNREE